MSVIPDIIRGNFRRSTDDSSKEIESTFLNILQIEHWRDAYFITIKIVLYEY